MRTDRQTDRHDKLTVAFRNYVNAPKDSDLYCYFTISEFVWPSCTAAYSRSAAPTAEGLERKYYMPTSDSEVLTDGLVSGQSE